MICSNCKRRLRMNATSCLCGKFMGTPEIATHIDCCFVGCIESSICGVPTVTGWANVCRTHYPEVEIKRRPTVNLATREIRAAYEKSQHYRQKHLA
mgnify:CR=1 FL=1